MLRYDSHISGRELLLAAGGELTAARTAEIRDHLDGCPSCWMRNAALEQTLADVIQAHHREFDGIAPPMEASRDLLRARLAQTQDTYRSPALPRYRLALAAAMVVLVGAVAMWTEWPARRSLAPAAEFAPNAVWTPGSVRPVTRDAVCSAPDRDEPVAVISPAVAQEVFHRYGIRNPRPRSYEVDYLIPPALGGSNEPRNLWPQPYSAGVWNARVKDALEDRLRALVCEGKLDLATAQNDLARDWIAAYKKYFRTGTPLLDHVAFIKDRPWE